MSITGGVVPAGIHDLIDQLDHKLTGMPAIDGRAGECWWKVQTAGKHLAENVLKDIQKSTSFPQAAVADEEHIWLRLVITEEKQDHGVA